MEFLMPPAVFYIVQEFCGKKLSDPQYMGSPDNINKWEKKSIFQRQQSVESLTIIFVFIEL